MFALGFLQCTIQFEACVQKLVHLPHIAVSQTSLYLPNCPIALRARSPYSGRYSFTFPTALTHRTLFRFLQACHFQCVIQDIHSFCINHFCPIFIWLFVILLLMNNLSIFLVSRPSSAVLRPQATTDLKSQTTFSSGMR